MLVRQQEKKYTASWKNSLSQTKITFKVKVHRVHTHLESKNSRLLKVLENCSGCWNVLEIRC